MFSESLVKTFSDRHCCRCLVTGIVKEVSESLVKTFIDRHWCRCLVMDIGADI